MASGDEAILPLREALKVSPNNLPLRIHLAQTLTSFARHGEAALEYLEATKLSPRDTTLKVSLAEAYRYDGKGSEAMVIMEHLVHEGEANAAANLLYARLLFETDDVSGAKHQYRKAIEADGSLTDAAFENELGMGVDLDGFEDDGDVDELGRIRAGHGETNASGTTEIERPKVKFADVGGMEGLKEEIRMKIIHPMNHPELYEAYGKAIGGGILMYGPPGCGKTYLARATAGEVNASFICVSIHDVLDMWIGNSEQHLHAIFEQARANTPCVLFFDEVDALAASRSDMRGSAGRHTINQFLAELDGVQSSNEGVLILAATNAPWHLDSAFRRPGRFDRIIFVPPPDVGGRAAITELMLAGKPVEKVDAEGLAKKIQDFSGADIKAMIDIAVERKLADAMKTGVPTPLMTKDLQKAAKQVKPSTKEWFATARNYAMYSNQGGAYDEILDYLKLR